MSEKLDSPKRRMITFRVTQTEKKEIDRRIKASHLLTKRMFYVSAVTEKRLSIESGSYMSRKLQKEFCGLQEDLLRIEAESEVEDELIQKCLLLLDGIH